MTKQGSTNVSAAFEILLEEIEDEIEFVNQAGAKAFATGQYDGVEASRQQAVKLSEYRDELAALRKEWQMLSEAYGSEARTSKKRTSRRDFGRLQDGVRTPEDAFRIPILQALVKLGGSGRVRDVLEIVEQLTKDQLNEVDYENLPSSPGTPRWSNTAQWARDKMVKEGLLRDDSRRGVWQISEAGRRHLTKQ